MWPVYLILTGSKYVSLFWGGMLIGRFMAAVELSEMKAVNKQLFLLGIPILGFLLFWTLRSWNSDQGGFDFAGGWVIVKNYLPLLALCWLLFQFGQALANRTLMIFSLTIVVLLAISIFMGGRLAMWCIVGIGLFTSIGFPSVFSLALDGIGIFKSQASSLLVMAISRGARCCRRCRGGSRILSSKAATSMACNTRSSSRSSPMRMSPSYGWKGHKIGRQPATPAS